MDPMASCMLRNTLPLSCSFTLRTVMLSMYLVLKAMPGF